MDCGLQNFPGKSIGVGCHFSRGSSWSRDQTWVSLTTGRGFTSEPPGKPYNMEKLPTKVHLVKPMIFPVVMHGCESWTTKSWVSKNWCFRTVVLEKTLECPLDCKEIKPINPKGNQSWIFIGRTDTEAETLILWPPDVNNWLNAKDPEAGKDWRWKEKGMTEDEMVGWHHRLDGHEFEQAPGVGDGQGFLACCNPWDHKELDMTEGLNWVTNIGKLWLQWNDNLKHITRFYDNNQRKLKQK